MRNPNPQEMEFSQWEAVTITVIMRPTLTTPWVVGDTFQLNIRKEDEEIVLQSASFLVTDLVNGVVQFSLTSSQTGAIEPGDYLYDCWMTTVGSEKRLAFGPLSELAQQWK